MVSMDDDLNPNLTTVALEPGVIAARYLDVAVTAAKMVSTTRVEVEAAYRHPEPEVEFDRAGIYSGGPKVHSPASLIALADMADKHGWGLVAYYSRGTTKPTWRVNLPVGANPGPPIEASQYHGDVVDCFVLVGRHPERGQFIAVWHDGRTKGAVIQPKGGAREAVGITELGSRITA